MMRHALLSRLLQCTLVAAMATGPVLSPASASEVIKVGSDDQGIKRFTIDGKTFIPVGVNYLISHAGAPYKTFDMFDTKDFHQSEIDGDLKAIADNGFNFVRLWLKGLDPDEGFGEGPYKIGDAYADNVYKTVRMAQQHGLHVVLTVAFKDGLWLPKNYLPTTPLPDDNEVGGMNRLLLLPEMAHSTAQFIHDLLVGLEKRDPGILSSIFYIDLYNEFHFDITQPPLSKSSGQFAFNGKTYDLGNAGSRQALMDQATEYWIRDVKGKVRDVKPDILVTASSFYLAAVDHNSFDGGMKTKGAATSANYPLRPSAMLRGGADILDVHMYPSPARPGLVAFHVRADSVEHSNEITDATARDVPLIAGEFGAYKKSYPTADTAPPELLATMDVMCRYHIAGYAVWMWKGTGDSWMLSDKPLLETLAPKYHPIFCGKKIPAPG